MKGLDQLWKITTWTLKRVVHREVNLESCYITGNHQGKPTRPQNSTTKQTTHTTRATEQMIPLDFRESKGKEVSIHALGGSSVTRQLERTILRCMAWLGHTLIDVTIMLQNE
jgi:hypothetical protein